MLDFSVYEPDINYSDHLPIMCTLACCFDRPNDDSIQVQKLSVIYLPASNYDGVEFYLYPTVGTVLIHSVKPELTE